MKDLLDKFTYQFVIAQFLPGSLFTLSIYVLVGSPKVGDTKVALEGGYQYIYALYATALGASHSAAEIVAFISVSILIGVWLHGVGIVLTANRESFRTVELNDRGIWIKRTENEIRKRSKLRQAIADQWITRSSVWLLLSSGLMLAFDLLSILAAPVRGLYKEILEARAETTKVDLLRMILRDYEHIARYALNMSMALGCLLIINVFLLIKFGQVMEQCVCIFVIYLLISGHYFLARTIGPSIDRAIYMTFPKEEEYDSLFAE